MAAWQINYFITGMVPGLKCIFNMYSSDIRI